MIIDQSVTHRFSFSENVGDRLEAVNQLQSNFEYLYDKSQAWNDLYRLTVDTVLDIRWKSIYALGSVFSSVPEEYIPTAWSDLHKLATDGDSFVRWKAVSILILNFSLVPDKSQVWIDLHKLTGNAYSYVRWKAVSALGSAFSSVPDKFAAWADLHRLTVDENSDIRKFAASALDSAFSSIPDECKFAAWVDLIRLTNDEDLDVRSSAASVLSSAFSSAPDKPRAWTDLIKLTNDDDSYVQWKAASALISAFSSVPAEFKSSAWTDLIRLTDDENVDVRRSAASALGPAFSSVPEEYKSTAWGNLYKMAIDGDSYLRWKVGSILVSNFSLVPDKSQVWADLYNLKDNAYSYIRWKAVFALGSVFPSVPNKLAAWDDLHRLTVDENSNVRKSAVSALGLAFSSVSEENKSEAWADLIRLTGDMDSGVRCAAASVLSSAFSSAPDKTRAWNDLIGLSSDKNPHVRMYVNHSLGKICIYKASKAENESDSRNLLDDAIQYFEKAAKETSPSNPAVFCNLFYRSFDAIIFKKVCSKEEIDDYIVAAKKEIRGSESKQKLLEAIQQLAYVLETARSGGENDIEYHELLIHCSNICNRVDHLMEENKEKTPAIHDLYKKARPSFDVTIKKLIVEVKEKADAACMEAKGTPAEKAICKINKKVQELKIGSQEYMKKQVHLLYVNLKSSVPKGEEYALIHYEIDSILQEDDLVNLLSSLNGLFHKIIAINQDAARTSTTSTVQRNIDFIVKGLVTEVQGVFPMNYNSETKPQVAIITALPKEHAAVKSVFENYGKDVSFPGDGAGRTYCLIELNSLNGNKNTLVLANAGMGTNIAAIRATLLLEHFSELKYVIMVGIAGGIPNPKKVDDHVRLGDIVVSNEKGVIQYDNVKRDDKVNLEHRHPPRPPNAKLLEIARLLESNEILGIKPWLKYIDLALNNMKISRPSEGSDKLYKKFSSGARKKIIHPEDPKRNEGQPRVFLGPIGSANILQKDYNMRDKLRDTFGIKAIEMEASGIADATWNHEAGYLVIRGICDYCDSNKNDEWQQYAAVVAAAYTRALVESIS